MRRVIAYIKEGFYTLYSIAKGHIVTFVNLFRKKVTLQYPEVRWELPECITVEAHMDENKKRVVDSFTLDASRCAFCNQCVEACNFDAIRMSKDYELASFSREDVMLNREKLNEIGGVREPKPKEPEEPEKPEEQKEAA